MILKLEKIGYQHKGEYNIPFRYFFSKNSQLKIHLHAYCCKTSEIDFNILFRNYLRNHPQIQQDYSNLKLKLLKDENSAKKENSSFSNYTLNKYFFIQQVAQQAGFKQIRFLLCQHPEEWQAAQKFWQRYFFDQVLISDPYTWTFEHPEHVHLILYLGTVIIGYAHLQFWPQARAAIRIIVIDQLYQHQGYGKKFLILCEQWLRHQGYKTIHTESSPFALSFYEKQSYTRMPFDDPAGEEMRLPDIAMGKSL